MCEPPFHTLPTFADEMYQRGYRRGREDERQQIKEHLPTVQQYLNTAEYKNTPGGEYAGK